MKNETVNELNGELTAALATITKCRELSGCPEDTDLQDWVKQMTAENMVLKAFGNTLNEMHNALNGEGTGIQGRAEMACQQVALEAAMEEFDTIETHATNRIVARIKAEGVDIIRNALIKFVEDEVGLNDVVPGLIRGAEICVSVADSLRED